MKEFRLLNKLIACICVLLTLCACADTLPSIAAPDQTPAPEGVLHIPYCSSDSLNPFFCEGEDNALLWPLAYLPLYELDNNFTPQPVAAATAVQTAQQLQITIRAGLMTPQGAQISVADVLYSFRLAKESPAFKAQLSVFTNIAIGATADVIVFTLSRPNVNACSLLTFPIVQYGTADKSSDLPIGAGPYAFVKTAEGYGMTYNPNYYNGNARSAQITLVDAESDASKTFSIKSERIDCTFNDMSEGNILRLAATATAIPMTNLVFLGVNADSEHLDAEIFRKAISHILDRQAIAEHAFCGYAQPTSFPVHPDWSALTLENIPDLTTADNETARQLLAEYESTGETPTVSNEISVLEQQTTKYTLRLICCAGNDFKTGAATRIAEQLSAENIAVNVEVLEEEDYFEAVENGDYDLYLGEVRMTADMNLSIFLVSGGTLGWGIDNDAITCSLVWDSYCAGANTLGDFLTVFAEEMPFIPLCFRQGVFYTSRKLVNEVFCTPDNLFYNVTVWEKGE